MKLFLAIIGFVYAIHTSLFASDIKGFEDPALLERVLSGETVIKKVVDSKLESEIVVKSYFKKVSPDAYMDLTVSYNKYPDMFEEVQSGKLLSVNEQKTVFNYRLDLLVSAGLLQQHVYPEGRHTFDRANDAISESVVHNTVTNYKENIEIGTQTIRLIPYQGGMLVEDTAHVKISKSMAFGSLAKQKFQSFFTSYTRIFRDQLHGND